MTQAYLGALVGALILAAGCGGTPDMESDSPSASTPQAGGGGATSNVACGIASPPEIGALTPNGIGDLRVGAAISDLRARCVIVADTTLPGPEGTQERRVTVLLAGDSVTATVDGDSVWRIEVDSPTFRTRDSLGVGTLGRDLKRAPGTIATGEGNVAALRTDHCGLSFLLAGATSRTRWATLPDSARVRRVLIIGCPNAPAPQ
jgi:hypothetical protein